MPLVEVWKDERYPDYGITVLTQPPPYKDPCFVELTDIEIKTIQDAERIYTQMQDFLAAKIGEKL